MPLRFVRIRKCFGFVDSGTIDFPRDGEIYYLLGRNSSGKTSLLTAIASLDCSKDPVDDPRFRTFHSDEKEGLLEAAIDAETSDFSMDVFRGRVRSLLGEQYLRQVPDNQVRAEVQEKVSEFVDSEYSGLFEILEAKAQRIHVNRQGDRTLAIWPEADSRDGSLERHRKWQKLLRQLAPDGVITRKANQWQTRIHELRLESLLHEQLPRISFFSDEYSLGEDLPDRITLGTLQKPDNEVTISFLRYLGQDQVNRLLTAEDPAACDEITAKLQARLEKLCQLVNRASARSTGRKRAGLLEMRIDLAPVGGIQITTYTDSKPSFYRHISENTKFLFSYFLHSEAEETERAVLLFDEPNRGFHPSAEPQILDFLKRLASQGHRVIASTHSQYLIDLGLLRNAKLMTSDSENRLSVKNGISRRASPEETLALQPVYDAIGQQFFGVLEIRDRIVLLEGLTDFIYLRAFFERFGGNTEFQLVPARSASHILTLLPFVIAQGRCFKVVLDIGEARRKLQEDFQIPDESIYEVPLSTAHRKFSKSGIEDLFSFDDFGKLLAKAGIGASPSELGRKPNSWLLKEGKEKARLAYLVQDELKAGGLRFDAVTVAAFRALHEFCTSEANWFRI